MILSWWTRVRTWGLRHGGRETGAIDRIFEENLRLPGKLRLAAKHIFERLRDEYDFLGGYTIVKEFVREHRCRTREMFVPLAHPPGHAQCDFGGALVVIGGVEQKAHCLILRRPKPGYHVLQRLTEGGPEEAVTGIAQHQDRRPAVRRRPVSGSWIRPNCPKSSSATFPGGLSSSRPAVLLGLFQFRFWMKPRGDW